MERGTLLIRLLFVGLLLPVNLLAEEQIAALPSPLSLQTALDLMDISHPDIELSAAQLQQAQAELALSESKTGFRSYLDLIAARARPSTMDEEVNDN